MDNEEIASLLYPDVVGTIEDVYRLYPSRDLDKLTPVTCFGPSPIGSLHVGSLLYALVIKMLAHQHGGTYIVRFEDTDVDRSTQGGEEDIIAVLKYTDTLPDEGPYRYEPYEERGLYGPYRQTDRKRLYRAFAKHLVSTGRSYPFFMTKSELDQIREDQASAGEERGIYGKWARSRMLGFREVTERLDKGMSFVIRYKAQYPESRKVVINDLVRGPLELPANNNDMVLVKSDGLPTYHLAHPVDDSLMQVSIVVRGNNLLALAPLHVDLFRAINRAAPVYVHLPFILRKDGRSRRLVSRGRDSDLAITHFREKGYPIETLAEYLLNLADSGFEEWREQNPELPYSDFPLELARIRTTDVVFDISKYHGMARKYIATLDLGHAFDRLLAWAQEFQPTVKAPLERDPSLTKRVLRLASSCSGIAKWEDLLVRYGYFFDEIYNSLVPEGYEHMPGLPQHDVLRVLNHLAETAAAVSMGSREAWLKRIRQYALSHDLTLEGSPTTEMARTEGRVDVVLTVLRIALTAKQHGHDFYTIVETLGSDRTAHRLQMTLDHITERGSVAAGTVATVSKSNSSPKLEAPRKV